METTSLPSSALSRLQDLIEINVDSKKGFDQVAREIADPTLADVFRQLGQSRARYAEELKPYVTAAGKNPKESGSTLGSMHRWWIDMKGKLAGENSQAILNEAERGEDSIKNAYEKALPDLRGTSVESIVERQYEGVRSGHDQVKALRDRYRNPA